MAENIRANDILPPCVDESCELLDQDLQQLQVGTITDWLALPQTSVMLCHLPLFVDAPQDHAQP